MAMGTVRSRVDWVLKIGIPAWLVIERIIDYVERIAGWVSGETGESITKADKVITNWINEIPIIGSEWFEEVLLLICLAAWLVRPYRPLFIQDTRKAVGDESEPLEIAKKSITKLLTLINADSESWKSETKAGLKAVVVTSIVKDYEAVLKMKHPEMAARTFLETRESNLKVDDLR